MKIFISKRLKKALIQIFYGVLSFVIIAFLVGLVSARIFIFTANVFIDTMSPSARAMTLGLIYALPAILTVAPIVYFGIKKKWAPLIGSILALVLIYAIGFAMYLNTSEWQAQAESRAAKEKMQEIFATLLSKNKSRVEWNKETREEIVSMMGPFEYNEPMCEAEFNSDPPNQFVYAMGPSGEVSLSIPFNELWGNTAIKIPPYVVNEMEHLNFGPLVPFGEGGCGWVRFGSLIYTEPQSAQRILREFEKSDYKDLYSVKPTVKLFGTTQVVSEVSSSFCVTPKVTVIGKKHNYEILKSCGSEEDLPMLEKIAASIKFL